MMLLTISLRIAYLLASDVSAPCGGEEGESFLGLLSALERAEAFGQQRGEAPRLARAAGRHHDHVHVTAGCELAQDLATGATRRCRRARSGDHGDGREAALAVADGAKDGVALGTTAQAVRDVLHVAARIDAARLTEQCGADLEAGIGRVGEAPRARRSVDQSLILVHGTPLL